MTLIQHLNMGSFFIKLPFVTCILVIFQPFLASASDQNILRNISFLLPKAQLGNAYSYNLSKQIQKQTKSSHLIVNLSSMPSGINIKNGIISGIPLKQGQWQIKLALIFRNTTMNIIQRFFKFSVTGIVNHSIIIQSYPHVYFSSKIIFTGGIPPFKFEFFQVNSSRNWLRLNMKNNQLEGIPPKIQNISFVISIIDYYENVGQMIGNIVVRPNKFSLIINFEEGQFSSSPSYSISGGKSPFKYRHVSGPDRIEQRDKLFIDQYVKIDSKFIMGVYITDSSNITNYFNLTNVGTSLSNLRKENDVFSDLQHQFELIFERSFKQISIIQPIGLQSPIYSSRTIPTTILRTSNSNIQTDNTLIRSASTINNRDSCDIFDPIIQGSGTIMTINYSSSMIQLTNRILLMFSECTYQAFRGKSKTFTVGNFVSFRGTEINNIIMLISIINTS